MIPANIWDKTAKTNPDVSDELRLPSKVEGSTSIADIDVTFADIKSLGEKSSLYPIIEFLRASWVGDNKDRETSCRIGTMHVYFEKDGNLSMNFVSRQAFPKETQKKIMRAFRDYFRSQAQEH